MRALQEIQIRDPFVYREGGTCYLLGTTDPDPWNGPGIGFDVYRSQGNLTRWEGPFAAFRPPRGFWADRNFWAPELHCHGGAYYLLATFTPDRGRRGTAILRGEHPLGPFVPWSEGAVTPGDWECLDGTLFLQDGVPWMVFCHEWRQVGDGEVLAMPLAGDLKGAAGEPRLLFRATQAPWAGRYAARGREGYVTDGPYLHRAKNGALLLLWSTFGKGGNYCIGVATSPSGNVEGPWDQSPAPLYEADGGHGMVFTTADGRLYLAIHTPNRSPHERAIFVELEERDGGLSASGPIIR